MTPNILSLQYNHQYPLNWTHACEATFYVSLSASLANIINKLEYTKKYFRSNNISLKYSGVRSCYKTFIETNTTV